MHQQVWTWVGVCPVEDNSSMWKKFAIILFTFAVLVAHLSLIMASIMFIMQADYEGTLHAISLVTMIVATAYVLGRVRLIYRIIRLIIFQYFKKFELCFIFMS